jgi:endonuclease/exonuclease/phosphatase (EEP) superfamily protein YafD
MSASSQTRQHPRSNFIRRTITALAWLGVALLTTTTLVGALAQQWWVGELLSHLRLQYLVGLLICCGWLVGNRSRLVWVALIPIVMNLSLVLPLYGIGASRPAARPTARALQILHYNLDMTAPDHRGVFQYLRAHPTDILLLQELTPELNTQLATELQDYKVVYSHPLPNTHGSALLLPRTTSLQIIAAGDIHLPASSPRPMITATLSLDGHPFTLLSMHVVRPKDAYTESLQIEEYAAIAKWLRDQRRQTGLPIVVIGDFNTTPWSERFRSLVNESGLRDTSTGFGVQPTWPASLPFPLSIPIDHALVSPDIAVLARAPGPDLGGDHTPLTLTIAMTEEEAQPQNR